MKELKLHRWAGWLAQMAIVVGLSGCVHVKPRAFTFVQMCDPQLGFNNYEEDLARFKAAVRQVNDLAPDFVVICGDLVHTPNEQSFADFNAARGKLRVPSYCAAGNHDIGNVPTDESLHRYREGVGKDYFEFGHRGVRFVIVNTQLLKTNVVGETDKQGAWLDAVLERAKRRARPMIVVQHYPPFVKVPDEPEAYFNLPLSWRKRMMPEFEEAGVVAIQAGHTHTATTNLAGTIEVVTGETTSKSFDQRPHGFRLWHANAKGNFWHEFVPLRP